MKKLLFSLAMCLSIVYTNAQNADYKNVISASAGYNLFNAIAPVLRDSLGENNTFKTTPTYQLAFDHGFNKTVSLGATLSYNDGKATANDYVWVDAAGKSSIGNYTVKVSRITVGTRLLFHYGNSGKLDMYSGLRAGIGIWNTSFTSSNPNFDPADELDSFDRVKNGIAPQIQVIPFALNAYITENIGIGFETAIGSPYMAALNLRYRMGGSGRK